MYDFHIDDPDRSGQMNLYYDDEGMVSRFQYFTYKYAMDEGTGLPALGEGEYFRIKLKGQELNIKLMRKRSGWFDKEVADNSLETLGQKLSDDEVLWLALAVVEQRDRAVGAAAREANRKAQLAQRKLEAERHNERYNGDYPPKKLGQK